MRRLYSKLLDPGLKKAMVGEKKVKPGDAEFYRGKGGWRWRIRDKRNKKILSNGGQGYSRWGDMEHGFNRTTGNNAAGHTLWLVKGSRREKLGWPPPIGVYGSRG